MKSKFLKTVALLAFLVAFNLKTQAQTVPFTNNLSCAVVVGFELNDPSCAVCDAGSITIPANSTVMYSVDPACGGISIEGCIWVATIGGVAVAANHCNWMSCCIIPATINGPDPSGCSISGNYNVMYNYPTSWTINP